jgi:hypothetical protein
MRTADHPISAASPRYRDLVETDTAGDAAPGWYTDPYRRFEFRYFNGQRWTADVSVRGQRYVDHPQRFTPEQPSRPPGRGGALASFIVALCSAVLGWAPFMFVVTLAGAVVALVLGVRALRRIARGQPGRRFAVAGVALVPVAVLSSIGGILFTQELVERFVDLVDVGEYRIDEEQPCAESADLYTLRGTITNLDDRAHRYSIIVEFRTPYELFRRTTDTALAQPGDEVPWAVSGFSASPDVTCRVLTVSGGFGPPVDTVD